MQALKVFKYIVLIVIIFFGYYICVLDLAPWGMSFNKKVSESLSEEHEIVALAKKANVKSVSISCGLLSDFRHIEVELYSNEINDSKSGYTQAQACWEQYYRADFVNDRVLWFGFLNNDQSYERNMIAIKSEIKGRLALAEVYARNYKNDWKLKQ